MRPLLLALLVPLHLAALDVASPSGGIVVTVVTDSAGQPTWSVTSQGRPVVLPGSRLGLVSPELPGLDRGLRIAREERREVDERWKPVLGERAEVRDRYREAVIHLEAADGGPRRLDLTVRAYDEGAAVRVTVPAQPGSERFTITRDATELALPGDPATWPTTSAQGRHGAPVPLSAFPEVGERPLTLRLAPDLWASAFEAEVVNQARMRWVRGDRPGVLAAGLNANKFRQDPATFSTMTATATAERPWRMPWRALMVADSAGGLVERNYLVQNLNAPCAIADTSWIKPGTVMRETTLSTTGALRLVDYAAAHNIRYILFDAGWYGHEYEDSADATKVDVDPKRNPNKGPLDLQEVIKAGNAKGVGVILYVNRRALERQLDTLLPLYASWGVKGVKYGFVNVGPQEWTTWVTDAVRKAAEHRLMVDIHDEYRPMGLERTWPNLVTAEGIGGNEEFPTPVHNATVPFTRFLSGPADYTFCLMDKRLKVTRAHQLALSILYFSPWQVIYWYDRPDTVRGGDELRLWDTLPTTWDELRVVVGTPGEQVALARRNGTDWWLGGISPAGGSLRLPLNFLGTGAWTATLHQDGDPANPHAVAITTRTVDASTVLDLPVVANGGVAIRFSPVKP